MPGKNFGALTSGIFLVYVFDQNATMCPGNDGLLELIDIIFSVKWKCAKVNMLILKRTTAIKVKFL